MQQHVLQNLVATTRLTLGAESVWLRMVSELHDYREPVEFFDGVDALAPYLELGCTAQAVNGPRGPAPGVGVQTPLDVRVSEDGRMSLITLTISDVLLDASSGQHPRHNRRATQAVEYGTLMLGVRYTSAAKLEALLQRLAQDQSGTPNPLLLDSIVTTCGQIAWDVYQTRLLSTDPVTQLLGPGDFSLYLQQAADVSARHGESLILLFISPDDFALINREIGRVQADRILRLFADKVCATARREDRVFRYGGATIAVVARAGQPESGSILAAKIQASLRELPNVSEHRCITFSIGGVVGGAEPDADRDPRQLSLSADQALNRAKLLGGNQSVFFDGEFDRDDASLTNPLGSIFTADTVRDYRNGRILWHTISLIGTESDPARLACAFVALLEESLTGARAVLLDISDGEWVVLGSSDGFSDRPLSPVQQSMVEKAFKETHSQWLHTPSESVGAVETLAAPLISRGLTFGCLLFECSFELDASDQVFLKALADQIAGAIDRTRLAGQWAAQKESESEQLRAELRDLRSGVAESALIAVAPPMQDLLAYAAKIAPSNASVLILGESGTGKEVLARAIHGLSDRSDRPMVTVDCSAIAHSLIDSELFGRTKGAYTGADAAQQGRIAQAHGATLFLDEVGELPLDVQAKLLRFVQEKEITPVGSTQGRKIDTRIICATNRNLLQEIRDGRFREDLYYRLQVIQLVVPPLRQRREDVFPLVNHFLSRFATQFGRPTPQLTPQAWQKVESYAWPGNVRELQNTIMRCVLSVDGERIGAGDLQMGEELPAYAEIEIARAPQAADDARRHGLCDPNEESIWQRLRTAFSQRIEAALLPGAAVAPFGRWLVEDLVLAAALANSTRHSASLLGMAETTFRRQLGKARRAAGNAYHIRSDEWGAVTMLIDQLVAHPPASHPAGAGLFDRCQRMLLEEVAAGVGDNQQLGAGLMDISPPTYRRWLGDQGVAA